MNATHPIASRLIVAMFALLTVLGHAGSARADDSEPLDLAAIRPLAPFTELLVSGENHDTVARALTVRVDDRPAADYADRANEERMVAPGRFTLRLRLAALRTPRGRALDLDGPLLRARAFAPDGGAVTLAPIRLATPPGLPAGVRGWYFGPTALAPLAGLDVVGIDDARVSGPHVDAIARPGGDPVLAHGMRLTRFATPLPPGRWRVTLWTEDPGDWETLPPVLERRVRVNGADLRLERRDWPGWIAARYLAGREREADPAAPPFAALAARRGDRIAGVVAVGGDGLLTAELAGFPQPATHLAMLVAEPADLPPAGADAVEAVRAARFAEAWPVLTPPPAPPRPARLSLTASPAESVTAPGGVVVLRFDATAPTASRVATRIEWDAPALPTRLLWGMWRWRRPGAATAGLDFSAAHLRGDSAIVPLRPDLPRPLTVVVAAPAGTPPGRHRATLRLTGADGRSVTAAFAVEVLGVTRPEPAARVGVFLGFAPHLLATPEWSKQSAWRDARTQAACDMTTLHGLGLRTVTPPLGDPADPAGFVADLRAARTVFAGPLVAYETLRGLAARHTPAEAAGMLATLEGAIRAAGLAPPIWSVADEAGYGGRLEDVLALARAVHAASPGARLAGHLNDPRDTALLPELALASVNHGFGATAATVASLRARGVAPWLYNMPDGRRAAGLELWRSGADALLQWHARMPAADPFDPTDGREGDVQFLWPTPGVCALPDLDADLLALAEGAEDLRWLSWLDAAAARTGTGRGEEAARRLREQLRIAPLSPAMARDAIVAVARAL